MQASLAPSELGGVAKGLVAATPSLARLFGEQPAFFQQTNLFSQCLTKVFFPSGYTKLQDGPNSSGAEADKEFFYTLAGLAGLGQSFDGNGVMNRFLVGGGGSTFRSAPGRDRRQWREGPVAGRPLAADPAGHPPGLPRGRAGVQAAGALLHPGGAELQRPALARAPRMGAADEPRPSPTKAGWVSATRSGATARRSLRWSR